MPSHGPMFIGLESCLFFLGWISWSFVPWWTSRPKCLLAVWFASCFHGWCDIKVERWAGGWRFRGEVFDFFDGFLGKWEGNWQLKTGILHQGTFLSTLRYVAEHRLSGGRKEIIVDCGPGWISGCFFIVLLPCKHHKKWFGRCSFLHFHCCLNTSPWQENAKGLPLDYSLDDGGRDFDGAWEIEKVIFLAYEIWSVPKPKLNLTYWNCWRFYRFQVGYDLRTL